MKKLTQVLLIAAVTTVVAGLSSCGCCTGEPTAPPLKPLPKFQDIPQVEYPQPAAPQVEDSGK